MTKFKKGDVLRLKEWDVSPDLRFTVEEIDYVSDGVAVVIKYRLRRHDTGTVVPFRVENADDQFEHVLNGVDFMLRLL